MPEVGMSSGWGAAAEEAENLLNLRKQVHYYRRGNSCSAAAVHRQTEQSLRRRNQTVGGLGHAEVVPDSCPQLKRSVTSRRSAEALKTSSCKSPGSSFVKSMCRFYSGLFARKLSSGSPSSPAGRSEALPSLSVSFTKTAVAITLGAELASDRAMPQQMLHGGRSLDSRGCSLGALKGRSRGQKQWPPAKGQTQLVNCDISRLGGIPRHPPPRKGGLTSFFLAEAVTEASSTQPFLLPDLCTPAGSAVQSHLAAVEEDRQPVSQEPEVVDNERNQEQEVVGSQQDNEETCGTPARSGRHKLRLSPEGQCSTAKSQTATNHNESSSGEQRTSVLSPELLRDCASSRRHSLQLSPIGFSELTGQHYLLRNSPEGGEGSTTPPHPSLNLSEARMQRDRRRLVGLTVSCDSKATQLRSDCEKGQRLEVTLMHHSPLAPSQDSGFSDSGDSLSEKANSLPRKHASGQGGSLTRTASSRGGSLPRTASRRAASLPRTVSSHFGSLPRMVSGSGGPQAKGVTGSGGSLARAAISSGGSSPPRVTSSHGDSFSPVTSSSGGYEPMEAGGSRDSLARTSCSSGGCPGVSSSRTSIRRSAMVTPLAESRRHSSLVTSPAFGSGNFLPGI